MLKIIYNIIRLSKYIMALIVKDKITKIITNKNYWKKS
jgi:hypothetical protein